MDDAGFMDWLEIYRSKKGKPLDEKSKRQYFIDNKRVENEDKFDLDKEFDKDGLKSLLKRYAYGKHDELANRPNPTDLDINAPSVYGSLASHRTAIRHYGRFRSGITTP